MPGPALDGERLFSLATGRGGMPATGEWPLVALVLVAFVFIVGKLLMNFGLTRLEAGAAAGLAPFLVLVDMPMGEVSPGTALAANAAGCLIPFAICVKVLAERRVQAGALLGLIAIATLVSYASSEVVPNRGVLLHYRTPAFVIGAVAAALWWRDGAAAGAASYAAGAAGVIIGADLVRLAELAAAGNASRIVIGGAGLFDGIYLVAFLSAGIGASLSVLVRWLVGYTTPRRAPA